MKRVLETINGVVLFLMFIMVMTTVVFRNFLEMSSRWSQELSTYIFVFIVFIGSAAVMEDEKHISIDTLVYRFPSGVQRVIRIVVRLIIAPFLYVLVSGSFHNIRQTWGDYLPTVPWFRIGIIYVVVLVSGILMSFYLIVNLIQDIRGKRQSETAVMGTDLDEIVKGPSE